MRKDFFFHSSTKTDWELLELSFSDFVNMCAWAFGPKWGLWPKSALNDEWNKLHKDLFLISGTDQVEDTMFKIRDAWWDSKKK